MAHAEASPSAARPLVLALATTAIVTALSYALPSYKAEGVMAAFLLATYFLTLRDAGTDRVRHFGLSLGGLLELAPLSGRRMLRDALGAVGWALVPALIFFPAFWLGFVVWWQPARPFVAPAWAGLLEDAPGQLLVTALSEEAFYRGYLQTSLDDAWPRRVRVFGAWVGPGLIVTSALFALGHLLTQVDPNRLAVFFPSLVFGWLRARTGGIGAAMTFHAACNLFATFLGRGYGFQ